MGGFTALVEGLSFTESPRWRDGRLYFSDFHTHRVLAVTLDGDRLGHLETIATLDGQPGGIGWLPDGRMLMTSKHERTVMRQELDGAIVLHADLTSLASFHVNDMLVDAQGRAWVGNYGFDLDGGEAVRTTGLICVERDGSTRMLGEGLSFPNGMAITQDGRTLVVAESFGNRLSAFDFEGGGLGPRRTWAAFGDSPTTSDTEEIFAHAEAIPDGICLDAEGAVWAADVARCRLVRVAEGGQILEERSTDGVHAFACMLGGADGRTLFACIAPEFAEEAVKANHRAAVWMTTVDVPGA